MTRAYWEFLVHGEEFQAPIPSTKEFQRITRASRPRAICAHADSFSVARVRPRTSKGITDLLLLSIARLRAACPSKKICLSADSVRTVRSCNRRTRASPVAPTRPLGDRTATYAPHRGTTRRETFDRAGGTRGTPAFEMPVFERTTTTRPRRLRAKRAAGRAPPCVLSAIKQDRVSFVIGINQTNRSTN
ncbi:hypothetical protein PPYR_02570 [Photinus pyralis]|uniref:Uncharacterized protein n=1 Tax=Photinus pyralis TaxID=7054 RepID=A0A5N4B8T4_PHOPY|nr:hypothetical protein PPYR_15690 [Photinus pyralis]KAB0805600.1 hypothetical protein PPYR_02570 [Photinus pyralis]